MLEEIRVFIGEGMKREDTIQSHKYFVFDLDETIGSFSDLYLLCKIINTIQIESGRIIFQDTIQVVDQLLDIFPEFLRPGIIDILYYIYVKKRSSICDGVFIYTNNQCITETWTRCIMNYIEKMAIMPGLINNIVLAFKINDRIIEPKRTSQQKKYRDFIKCAFLPNYSSLCFIDNTSFTKMQSEYVYYIQPPPYFHTLTISHMITRLLTSDFGLTFTKDIGLSLEILQERMYNQSVLIGRIDTLYIERSNTIERLSHIETSRKLMYYIREYLFYSQKKRRKTMSYRKKNTNKTRRI
jgi:hypothetical protein